MRRVKILPSISEWIATQIEMFEAVVLDIDGVLMMEGKAIKGSRKIIRILRQNGPVFMLLTNDALHSVAEKAAKLRHSGIDIRDEEIVSCGDGLEDLAQELKLEGDRLFLMGSLGNPCYAEKAGLKITKDVNRLIDCRGVIIGEGKFDWELAINGALNYFLSNSRGLLIVPNPDDYYPVGKQRINIGPGAIARFMQKILASLGTQINPIFLGKPHLPAFQTVHRRLQEKTGKHLDRSRVLMVGDLLESDIRGARNFGYGSALVLSGLTDRAMLDRSDLFPDLVFHEL